MATSQMVPAFFFKNASCHGFKQNLNWFCIHYIIAPVNLLFIQKIIRISPSDTAINSANIHRWNNIIPQKLYKKQRQILQFLTTKNKQYSINEILFSFGVNILNIFHNLNE